MTKLWFCTRLLLTRPRRGKGCGAAFVKFYEEVALDNGCPFLRMDTNEKKTKTRADFTQKLGYDEVGIVPCNFNGIEGVGLVCL
ncbi:MAG: hypothetical protein L6V93_16250 [Clostridiales bacterium]|nr:MAG: hypothetical protein L6V93_16250 [Clostridiales bacterium]